MLHGVHETVLYICGAGTFYVCRVGIWLIPSVFPTSIYSILPIEIISSEKAHGSSALFESVDIVDVASYLEDQSVIIVEVGLLAYEFIILVCVDILIESIEISVIGQVLKVEDGTYYNSVLFLGPEGDFTS